MKVYLAVGIGGMIGSSLRYLISLFIRSNNFASFPWSTLIVNVTGAFLLSFILFHPNVKKKLHPTIMTALTTGIVGSYTTFSTITVEIVMLFQESVFMTTTYLLVTVFGGLFCSFIGYKAAHKIAPGGAAK